MNSDAGLDSAKGALEHRKMNTEAGLDSAKGALLGACIGDACGTLVERQGAVSAAEAEKCFTFPGGGFLRVASGQVTDDGELTVSLANALLEWLESQKSVVLDEVIAEHYGRWASSNPFDMGITTGASIGIAMRMNSDLQSRIDTIGLATCMRKAAKFTLEGQTSEANGSLMRCTPLGVFGRHLSDSEIYQLAAADSSLSHPHFVCIDCVALYSMAIAHLCLNPGDARGAYNRALNFASSPESICSETVRDWLRIADSREGVSFHGGHVKIGFIYAFRCLLHANSYREAIIATIAGGGDTDTNACIVGGLVGARFGFAKIPESARRAVIDCHPIRNRPSFLHPKGLLQAAEIIFEQAPSALAADSLRYNSK